MSTLNMPPRHSAPPLPVIELAVHEVKSGLSAVLAKVQSGMEAVITSHRKPIAKIVPITAAGHASTVPDNQSPYPVDKDGFRDTSRMPQIPGMRWAKRKGPIVIDFEPIQMTGAGPTLSEIIDLHRSGINYPEAST